MLTISHEKYTLSEVVTLIKNDPTKHWDKCYLNYLMKINGSGSTKFEKIGSLIERLEDEKSETNPIKNIHREANKNIHRERRRGKGPGNNAAMRYDPIKLQSYNLIGRNAINNMIKGRPGNGIIRKSNSKHQTDPETGLLKRSNVGVEEYYVNDQRSKIRLIKRTEQRKITYYYSDDHYSKYRRLE